MWAPGVHAQAQTPGAEVVAATQALRGGGAVEKVRLTPDNPSGTVKRGADDDVLHYYEHSALRGLSTRS